MATLRRIYLLVVAWFRSTPPPPASQRERKPRQSREDTGRYYFRGSILDELDRAVLITMPGLHHADLLDFELGSADWEECKRLHITKGRVTTATMGRIVDEAIRGEGKHAASP